MYTSTCSLQEIKNFYNSDTVIHNFNDILIGRWHSGLSNQKNGQEAMELQVAKYADLERVNHNGGLVLDFGSGVGTTICFLAEKYPNIRFIGLNISPKQVAMATSLAKSKNLLPRVKFMLYDGYKLPFSKNTFDAIIFFESICHVPHKRFLFQQLYQVLKPLGKIAGEDWNTTNRINRQIYERYILPVKQKFAIPSMLSLSQYDDLLTDAGFDVSHYGDLHESIDSFVSEYDDTYEPKIIDLVYAIKDVITNFVYRLKNNVNNGNKINMRLYDKLKTGYFDLNIAYQKKYITIGFFCAEKPKM